MSQSTPVEITEPVQPDTVRSPVTAIRFGVATLVVALGFVPLVGSGGDSSQYREQFGSILKDLPRWMLNLLVGSLQLLTLTAPVAAILALLVMRRFSRLAHVILAVLFSLLTMRLVAILVGTDVLRLGPPGPGAYGEGAAFPTSEGLAMLCAALFVESPWWTLRWRRVGRLVLVCAIAARVGSALAEPSTIVMALAVGAAAAQLTHLVLGVPNTRPRARDVAAVLGRFGYDLVSVSVQSEADFRGVATFVARCRDGRRLFVKVIGRESWAALFPVRVYRSLRFRELGDDGPFVGVRHRVEHEALCALKAYSDGVPTPRLTVVTDFPGDGMMLAFEAMRLRRIDDLDDEQRQPELLRKAWETVVALRRSNTVHHRLNGEYLMVNESGEVVLVDFSAAELGASERAMSSDVAEVLAITAARLGTQTAVAAAVEALGPQVVAASLPRLQPLALTRSTRAAVKEANCLDALRDEVQRVTGAAAVPVEDLERIKPRTLVTVVMAALGLWALLPQILGSGDVWGKTRTANLWWASAALGLSAITYLGAALALDGSLPERLPLGPNIGVQFATSFVGVAAPGGALALTARFLQRRGIDPALAVAAVGVDTVAGVMVHFSLIGVFVTWAGSSGLKSFNLPSVGIIGAVGIGVAAAVALAAAVPRSRSLMAAYVVPAVKRAAHGIAETARHPVNLLELFGGSAAITLGYLLALEVSVQAFGRGPSFTSVALVYLVGSVVSSVAPTPGGIGAVEATLVAGLTSAGMRSDTALGAVLLFRLATFWLPLVPGWFAFTVLQRSGNL